MSADIARHMEAVARHFWGDPNPEHSSPVELRWGSHGSRSVDLEKLVWHDHEAGEGGGVLDLVERETRKPVEGGQAADYLREQGFEIEPKHAAQDRQQREPEQHVEAIYDYIDEHGEVLMQVLRMGPKKTFRQRRPDPASPGGWSYSVKGVRPVIYRLPEVLKAIASKRRVFVVEGEKDADNLGALGFVATCNVGGATAWRPHHADFLAGAEVVIIPDNDDPGRKYAELVRSTLAGKASKVLTLEIPGLGPKQDVSDWIAAGGTKQALIDLVKAHAVEMVVEGPVRPPSQFGAIYWGDLDSIEPRSDWLAEDIIFCGDIGMFYGASSSGKSFLAVDLGLSIALGRPFLGKKVAQGGVIYQAGEGGKGLVKRLHAYKQRHNIYQPDVPFVLLPERLDMFSDGEAVESFIAECQLHAAAMRVPLRVVFIDTFSTASPGANENASEDVSRLLAAGERIAKTLGCALIWVHHKNAGGDKARGHTSIGANVDTAVEVTREEDGPRRTMHLTKIKDGEDGLKIDFELKVVSLGEKDGKEITSCVVEKIDAPAGVAEAARFKLPAGQVRFLRALDHAIARGGGQLPPLDGVPPRQIGVEINRFNQIHRAQMGDGKSEPAIRQARSRDTGELVAKGLVGTCEGWIWLTPKGELWLR